MNARIAAAKVAIIAVLCFAMPGSASRGAAETRAGMALPKLTVSGPAAALEMEPPRKFVTPEMPESSVLLLVGGALVSFGLVGRKRRS